MKKQDNSQEIDKEISVTKEGNANLLPGEPYQRCRNGCELCPPGEISLMREDLSYFGLEEVIAGTNCPKGGNAGGITFAEMRFVPGNIQVLLIDQDGIQHKFDRALRIAFAMEGDIECKDFTMATRFISDVLSGQSGFESNIAEDREKSVPIAKDGFKTAATNNH